jgi:TatD DNase family protein
MHPHTAADLDASALARIESLLGDPKTVAVGETGLDFFRMLSPAKDQERAFRAHASLSRSSGKPMVVHCREAWPRVLEILGEEEPPSVVLHCFSGDAEVAAECASRGWYLSFAGNVTYPANGHLRGAAAAVPAGQLLVETDSPFLSPQASRGEPNRPGNIAAVVEELARVRGEPVDEVARVTLANAREAFSTG